MPEFNRDEVVRLASVSSALDAVAALVCEDLLSKPSRIDVTFSKTDEPYTFRANIHRIKLVVRYEQVIQKQGEWQMLKETFVARLDEPIKADQDVISSFVFDLGGNTESAGGVLQTIVEDPTRRTVRDDFTMLLAHDVQQYIQVKPAEKRKARVTDFKL
jgi:hypothetical protein